MLAVKLVKSGCAKLPKHALIMVCEYNIPFLNVKLIQLNLLSYKIN